MLAFGIAFILIAVRHVSSDPSCQSPPTVALNLGPCRVLAVNESDVSSFGITIGIQGTEICVAPSTTVNTTFLTEASICADGQLGMDDEPSQRGVRMTSKQCRSRRGGFINKNTLATTDVQPLKDLNPGWSIFGNKLTAAATTTLQLLEDKIIDTVGLITEGQKSTQSHLALSSGSTFLARLKDNGLIGALSWGLNSGSQSLLFPRVGSLVLGGFDKGSLAGPFYDYPINPAPLETRYCPLQVLVTGLTVWSRNGTESKIIDKANKLSACIEPYDNLFRMPENLLGQFQQLLKGSLVEPKEYADKLFNLEPGLVYRKDSGADLNATLRFTINYNQTVEIPFYEVQRSLVGLDTNGSVVVDADYNQLQIFPLPAPGDAAVLGKVFLSQLYLYVNYESMTFHLASQKAEATTPLPAATGDICPSSSSRLSAEAKGLIAIGAVLGVLLAVLAVLVLYRWRKRRTDPSSVAVPATAEPTADDHGSAVSDRPHSTGDMIPFRTFVGITSERNRSTDSVYGRHEDGRLSTLGGTTAASNTAPVGIGG